MVLQKGEREMKTFSIIILIIGLTIRFAQAIKTNQVGKLFWSVLETIATATLFEMIV